MLYIRMLFPRIVYDGPKKGSNLGFPSIENWLVTSMCGLKNDVLYLYLFIRKVFS